MKDQFLVMLWHHMGRHTIFSSIKHAGHEEINKGVLLKCIKLTYQLNDGITGSNEDDAAGGGDEAASVGVAGRKWKRELIVNEFQ